MATRLPIDSDRVEDMPCVISWRLRHQMGFIFETPLEAVQVLLPHGLYPVEARPGVGLVFCGYNDYFEGNQIRGQAQPRFYEITRCVLVQPDLSIKMPIPRFTFFVHRIGSNNAAFIEQEITLLRLPSYGSATLVGHANPAGTEVTVEDEHGVIRRLRSTHPAPVYRNDSFFGQYYSVQDGKLYFGVWNWRGVACIHQRAGDAGGPCEHPFLTQVQPALSQTAFGASYMQVFTRPGELSESRFYQPRFLRDSKSRGSAA